MSTILRDANGKILFDHNGHVVRVKRLKKEPLPPAADAGSVQEVRDICLDHRGQLIMFKKEQKQDEQPAMLQGSSNQLQQDRPANIYTYVYIYIDIDID